MSNALVTSGSAASRKNRLSAAAQIVTEVVTRENGRYPNGARDRCRGATVHATCDCTADCRPNPRERRIVHHGQGPS
jgi:hypothetical protein